MLPVVVGLFAAMVDLRIGRGGLHAACGRGFERDVGQAAPIAARIDDVVRGDGGERIEAARRARRFLRQRGSGDHGGHLHGGGPRLRHRHGDWCWLRSSGHRLRRLSGGLRSLAPGENALTARIRARRRGGDRLRRTRRDIRFLVFVPVLLLSEAEQVGKGVALLGVDAGRARGVERDRRRRAATEFEVGERERIAFQRLAVGRNVDRAAVREHFRELIMRHARPVAHAANVEMHERRARARIEADAAALHAKARGAQILELGVRNEEVDRLADGVLAVLRDAARAAAQHRIGRRRAVAAYDMDRTSGTHLAMRLPHQVDQVRVHPDLLVLAPVAHQPVDLLQRGVVVTAVALVGDGEVFARMQVMERDRARIAVGDCVMGGLGTGDDQKGGEANACPGAGHSADVSPACGANWHVLSRVMAFSKAGRGSRRSEIPNAVLPGRVKAGLHPPRQPARFW